MSLSLFRNVPNVVESLVELSPPSSWRRMFNLAHPQTPLTLPLTPPPSIAIPTATATAATNLAPAPTLALALAPAPPSAVTNPPTTSATTVVSRATSTLRTTIRTRASSLVSSSLLLSWVSDISSLPSSHSSVVVKVEKGTLVVMSGPVRPLLLEACTTVKSTNYRVNI